MSQSLLITKTETGVFTITLNRPEIHNAFDEQFIKEFIKVITTIQNDSTVKIVLIRANGKNFSAGANLHWMKKMAQYSEKDNYADSLQLAKLMQQLYELTKPTIAVVQGQTFGGGLGLIACCDIAIACSDASFCFSEVKLGLIPAVISPYVIKAIGQRSAQRYFLTAELFDAHEAHRIGLIHQIVNTEELESHTNTLCNLLLQNSPCAIIAAKKLIHEISSVPIDETVSQLTAKNIAAIRVSKEGQEGLQAFLEKRKPNWKKD
jgi:methylglutaconyl-CoA hydratase